jgi:hypothetical protein
VKREDVVLAATGASAAIAGLVLVFLGVLVTSYQQLLGTASQKSLDRFKRASWLTLGVFIISLIALTLSTSWLVADGGKSFYVAALVFFFLQLGALAVVAAYSTCRRLLHVSRPTERLTWRSQQLVDHPRHVRYVRRWRRWPRYDPVQTWRDLTYCVVPTDVRLREEVHPPSWRAGPSRRRATTSHPCP